MVAMLNGETSEWICRDVSGYSIHCRMAFKNPLWLCCSDICNAHSGRRINSNLAWIGFKGKIFDTALVQHCLYITGIVIKILQGNTGTFFRVIWITP